MKRRWSNMTPVVVWLCALLGAASVSAQNDEPYLHEGPILLRNVTIIDGLGTDPLLMRDVLVRGGTIAKITVTGMSGTLPAGTKVITGEDLTVMPGLMDLHAHLGVGVDFTQTNLDGDELAQVEGMNRYFKGFGYRDGSPEAVDRYFNAFLYSGVTTLLEVGGLVQERSVTWRDEINEGKRVGPTLYLSGQIIEYLKTPTGVMSLTSLESRAEIEELIQVRRDAGIKHVKLYAGVAAWQARHISHEAHKYGMKVNADLWGSNLSQDIMEIAGLDSYAHGGILEVSRNDARWMAENDKFATLTLAIFESQTGSRVYEDFKTRGFLKNPLVVDVWGIDTVEGYYEGVLSYMEQWNHGEKAMYTVQLWGNKQGLLDLNMRNAKIMWEEGVQVGMGTDSPWPPGNWAGESMHRELELHVMAGLPPLEVIKMATYNNARYLEIEDEVGSVEIGKTADLLVITGDPSKDIRNTRNIVHVIKGGKLVNREALKYR